MHKIFVYGTLMSSMSNNHILGNSTKISNLLVSGYKMYSYNNVFPFVEYTGNDEDIIFGELYDVDDITMLKVDILEGVSTNRTGLYKKDTLPNGAYIYVKSDPEMCGDAVPVLSEICPEFPEFKFQEWKSFKDNLESFESYYENNTDSDIVDDHCVSVNTSYINNIKPYSDLIYNKVNEIISLNDDSAFDELYDDISSIVDDNNGYNITLDNIKPVLKLLDIISYNKSLLSDVKSKATKLIGESANGYVESIANESNSVLQLLLKELKNED